MSRARSASPINVLAALVCLGAIADVRAQPAAEKSLAITGVVRRDGKPVSGASVSVFRAQPAWAPPPCPAPFNCQVSSSDGSLGECVARCPSARAQLDAQLAGVPIAAVPTRSTTSSASGEFSVALPAGVYDLLVWDATGATTALDVTAGSTGLKVDLGTTGVAGELGFSDPLGNPDVLGPNVSPPPDARVLVVLPRPTTLWTAPVATNGKFRLPAIPAGVLAWAQARGYGSVGLMPLTPTPVRLLLTRLHVLRGVVLSNATPVAGATVELPSEGLKTTTAADGSFVFPASTCAACQLDASHGDKVGAAEYVARFDGPVTIAIAPSAALEIHLVDAKSRRPINGGDVQLFPGLQRTKAFSSTVGGPMPKPKLVEGAEGTFRFGGAALGLYLVQAAAHGFVPRELSVKVEKAGTQRINVLLDRGLSLSGTVSTAEGTPVAGASVELGEAPADNMTVATTRTSSTGSFLLEGLQPGRKRVKVRVAGFLHDGAEVTLPRATPLALVVSAGATLDALVITPDGAPVAGATVALSNQAADRFRLHLLEHLATAYDGHVLLGPLGPGEYTAVASARGTGRSKPTTVTVIAGATTQLVLRLSADAPAP